MYLVGVWPRHSNDGPGQLVGLINTYVVFSGGCHHWIEEVAVDIHGDAQAIRLSTTISHKDIQLGKSRGQSATSNNHGWSFFYVINH